MTKNTVAILKNLFPGKDDTFLLTAGLLAPSATQTEEGALHTIPQTGKKARELASNEDINAATLLERAKVDRATEDRISEDLPPEPKDANPREGELKEYSAATSTARADMLYGYAAWLDAGIPTEGADYAYLKESAERYQQATDTFKQIDAVYRKDRHTMYYNAMVNALQGLNQEQVRYPDNDLKRAAETIIRMEIDEKAATIHEHRAQGFAQDMVGNIRKNINKQEAFVYTEFNKDATNVHNLIYWAFDARAERNNEDKDVIHSKLPESSSFKESTANNTFAAVIHDETQHTAEIEKELQRQQQQFKTITGHLSEKALTAFNYEAGKELSQNLETIETVLNAFKDNARQRNSLNGLESAKEALARNAEALETANRFKRVDTRSKAIDHNTLTKLKEQSALVSDSIQSAVKGLDPAERGTIEIAQRKPGKLGSLAHSLKHVFSNGKDKGVITTTSAPFNVSRQEIPVITNTTPNKGNGTAIIQKAISRLPRAEATTPRSRRETRTMLVSMYRSAWLTRQNATSAVSGQEISHAESRAIEKELKPTRKMLDHITRYDRKLTKLENESNRLDEKKTSLIDRRSEADGGKLQDKLDKKIKKIQEKVQKIAEKTYTTAAERKQGIHNCTHSLDAHIDIATKQLQSVEDGHESVAIAKEQAKRYSALKAKLQPAIPTGEFSAADITSVQGTPLRPIVETPLVTPFKEQASQLRQLYSPTKTQAMVSGSDRKSPVSTKQHVKPILFNLNRDTGLNNDIASQPTSPQTPRKSDGENANPQPPKLTMVQKHINHRDALEGKKLPFDPDQETGLHVATIKDTLNKKANNSFASTSRPVEPIVEPNKVAGLINMFNQMSDNSDNHVRRISDKTVGSGKGQLSK